MYTRFLLILFVPFIFSCASYKKHLMFTVEEGTMAADLEQGKLYAERNYRIQVDDILEIKVYTNEGERIVDPDFELQKDLNNINIRREEVTYFVDKEGEVKVPMIGKIKLEGLTIREAEKKLEVEFSAFYKDPFVVINFNNKRVIVLGAPGGHVIPLENEDTNLLEVIAMAGGIERNMNVTNIRLIRGELDNPEVQLIDLSTIEGLKNAELSVYSGDIIYIEPVVRLVSETRRDIIPILSITTSVLALIVIFVRN